MRGEELRLNCFYTMPRCCAGERCKFPSLGLVQGGPGGIKNCPDCGEKIHDVCAFEDGEAGLSKRNVCPDCWDARKPSLSFHAKEMLRFFAPGAENGEFREIMYQEFLKIRAQEDPYATKYMCLPPDALSYQDARQTEKVDYGECCQMGRPI
jgi:hypothetical protein